ncbi:MAG: glycerol-3-phosphate 1-O-acyltransferase PlsY [Hyphomicrobiales bacterium]|nr:glycerol-3-phosphate 1-O-acyltransferase PlsY [Hyphomicrobiales bacterium]
MMNPLYILAAAFGYLLGSIPFGLLITRFAGTEDIRGIGSGNIGATNVLRTGRKGLAAATLICDALKGTVPVVIMGMLGGPIPAMIAASAAFLGHLFPIWLGFKGGSSRRVSALAPIVIVGGCIAWLATALTSRYSSFAALTASAITPMFLWYMKAPHLAILGAVLTVLLWFMHRENIKRLTNGTEGKIGKK